MTKKYTLKTANAQLQTKIPYDKELNPEQLKVVLEGDGRCLVLAGAGSGKTRTLIYRVAYLLERGVPAEYILLVTFTNKAAAEMKTRVQELLRYEPQGLWCGTFHHVGNRSIRMFAKELNLSPQFGILDEEDSRDLFKSCIQGLHLKTTERRFPKPGIVQALISYARNACLTIEQALEKRYPYFLHLAKEIQEVQALYEKRKQGSSNLDYDDLLSRWIELMELHPHARQKLTRQFRYVLVDEYQDTNRLQYQIIDHLTAYHQNLLVVGDDAQSIYSFRAAEIRNILDFPKHFDQTKIFKLETNYRSTPQILDLANESITHNAKQFPKKLKAVKGLGEKPAWVAVKDPTQQSQFIAQRILELRDEGVGLKDIAVLFRARYQSAELELELVKRDIPYVVRGGVRFFEQAHIKDVVSHLKILVNPQDELAWTRALGLQPGIGSQTAEKIWQKFSKGAQDLDIIFEARFAQEVPPRAQAGFGKFKRLMAKLHKPELLKHPDALVEEIIQSGYDAYVRENFENAADRLDDLKELANFAHTYESLKDFLTDLTLREGFRGETILGAGREEADDEYLVLSTIHQAKGLEWKAVILIGLGEGLFPHPKAFEETDDLEEERRLFYVASTRAKDELYLVHTQTRFDYEWGDIIVRPSLFLEELPGRVYERWEVNQEAKEKGDELTIDYTE
ncbi:MAG: ATP-dependent helicase [Candidatus Omnitrophica bacterium]|nr:ATP-dependent helicase [Candidatus Omnitrophota bacterium]